MTKVNFDLFWKSNKDWYEIDEDFEYYLTPEAPPEAVKSFEHFKKQLREKERTL